LDNTQGFSSEDEEILDVLKDRNVIIIVNKIDLDGKIDIKDMQSKYDFPVVLTSITEGTGIKSLEEGIKQLFFSGGLSIQYLTYSSKKLRSHLLKQANISISDEIETAEMDKSVDMIKIDLVKTWQLLGEVIRQDVSEELIDQLFSQFCLGK